MTVKVIVKLHPTLSIISAAPRAEGGMQALEL